MNAVCVSGIGGRLDSGTKVARTKSVLESRIGDIMIRRGRVAVKKVIMLTEMISGTINVLWRRTHSDTMGRLRPRGRRMSRRGRDRVGPRMGVVRKEIKRNVGLHHLHIYCSHVGINERFIGTDQPKIGKAEQETRKGGTWWWEGEEVEGLKKKLETLQRTLTGTGRLEIRVD